MKVEFIRFKASDGVELQGWLSECDGNVAVIHIHGMSGNGYENHFLDTLRESYTKKGITFLTIDTRGAGIINSFPQGDESDPFGEGTKLGGSCFEIFEESVFDIEGAITLLQSRGKSKFIIQGHSLGCSKVVHYLTRNTENIIGAILLAPTDMVKWAEADPKHKEYTERAKELNAAGKGESLVGAECWLDKTPLSAQTYPTITAQNTPVDIYNQNNPPLGNVKMPCIIAYGDQDIGITQSEGTVDVWMERANKIKNDNTTIEIIKDASHSFRGHEDILAEKVEAFVDKVVETNQ